MGKILVWDWPVRIGHWLLAGAFALAWLTGDSEEWRLVHAYAGGTVVGVILFRLIWGLVGTYHARFTSFVRGPGGVLGYLRGLLAGRPAHTAGHNPAGGAMIVLLLAMLTATAVTGHMMTTDAYWGARWVEKLHETLAHGTLALAGLHVLGVAISGLLHHENLVKAMWTGRKRAP